MILVVLLEWIEKIGVFLERPSRVRASIPAFWDFVNRANSRKVSVLREPRGPIRGFRTRGASTKNCFNLFQAKLEGRSGQNETSPENGPLSFIRDKTFFLWSSERNFIIIDRSAPLVSAPVRPLAQIT